MTTDQRQDEELNRVIAEWAKADEAHWKCTGCGEKVPGTHVTYEEHHGVDRCMAPVVWIDKPNYCRDLNACHEAEKVMRDNPFNFVAYTRVLWEVVFPGVPYTGEFGYLGFTYVTATARQRAEALVNVIEQQKGQG